MSKLDDLIGAFGGENPEKNSNSFQNKNSTSGASRTFSRITSSRDVDGIGNETREEAHSDIPKSTRSNSAEYKTAKQKLLEDSTTNSRALPRGISDDSTGRPTDAYRDPTKPTKATGSTSNHTTHVVKNPRLRNLDPEMVDTILSNKVDLSKMIAGRDEEAEYFDGIAGLESVKNVLKEMFIVPMLHPEL